MPPQARVDLREFCRRTFDDPERGLADLESIVGSGSGRARDLLTRLLPETADPDLALGHLVGFARAHSIPDDRETLEALLTVVGFSPYLADAVLNEHDFLADLAGARRRGAWGVREYRDDLAGFLGARRGEDPWRCLRRYKRRVMLRVALADLQRLSPLAEVSRELSCAADALIQCALGIVMSGLETRFGRPQAYDESGRPIPASLAILALGKLGGLELNYSSDVDLLFLYSADGVTTGAEGRPEGQITNKEYFTRAAEALTRELSDIGPDGQCYRVDCRLRPGGRDGDLVVPLQAAAVYYRTWAHAWERQSLLKARACAGDALLGRTFLDQIESIIYPYPPDASVPASVRSMKDRIDGELSRRSEGAVHLKLGPGGIREVEFVVQALQMMQGGGDPWIREGNTLIALHRLADKGLISVGEHGALTAAYTFLREAEHRVQLPRNLQRSTLPPSERDRRVLARSMGYRDSAQRQEASGFLADLDRHQSAVRSIYDAVLARLSQPRLEEAPAPDLFLDRMQDAQIIECLRGAGLTDAEALLGGVRSLRRLAATWPLEGATRGAFRRVTPVVLEALGLVHHPVRALRSLERFLASLGLEPAALRRMLARPELIPPLLRLFAGSQPLTSALIHRPGLVLEEEFGGVIAADRDVGAHLRRLREALAAIPDEAAAAAFMKTYQRAHMLYVGLRDVSRQSTPAQVRRALSDLAEAIVRAALGSCARAAGWPPGASGEPEGFAVLGLGKLGYRELDFFSDLDLVFVYEPAGPNAAALHAEANRLAGSLVQTLTAITREGSLYVVDVRLRPFGGEGELALPREGLLRYFGSAADVWEMQSFLKARPVAGDLRLGASTVRELESALPGRAARLDLSRRVEEMKKRLEAEAAGESGGEHDIKLGPGGLNAIQFAIQLLQLRYGLPSPPHKSTPRMLAALSSAHLLDDRSYRDLFTGFQFLSGLEHRLRLQLGRAVSRLPATPEGVEEIAMSLGYPAGGTPGPAGTLLSDLERHRGAVEAAFRRALTDRAEGSSTGNVENPVETRPAGA